MTQAENKKFIPLLVDGTRTDLLPDELFGYTHYFIPAQAVDLAVALACAGLRFHPREYVRQRS